MNSRASAAAIAGFLVATAFGLSAVDAAEQKQLSADQKTAADQKQAQSQNPWRYTFHNGEWWYWLPAGRWVYWRDGRWNEYYPKTYVAPHAAAIAATSRSGATGRGPAASDGENHPFYGHVISNLDRRPLEANGEVGPFYGHALPSEVFGGGRERRTNRPFYGHAVSSSDD
jgi:hypothetical protein